MILAALLMSGITPWFLGLIPLALAGISYIASWTKTKNQAESLDELLKSQNKTIEDIRDRVFELSNNVSSLTATVGLIEQMVMSKYGSSRKL
jgi:hypothetical protein